MFRINFVVIIADGIPIILLNLDTGTLVIMVPECFVPCVCITLYYLLVKGESVNRHQFFKQASALFGNTSEITASVQNSGVLKTQEDMEEVLRRIRKEINVKQEECQLFVEQANDFGRRLREAFINKDLA